MYNERDVVMYQKLLCKLISVAQRCSAAELEMLMVMLCAIVLSVSPLNVMGGDSEFK